MEGRLKELSTMSNKLGIFSAVYNGQEWVNIKEFRFNSEWFNITAPCLSPDGRRLYFVSDRPDGYGGSDLYYSNRRGAFWDDPVNLGPEINTKGNESYPFMNEAGELFFSSDGHPGLGGRDIFVTKQRGSGWFRPERLEEPVNSVHDDFGFISDPLLNEGYFSSDRDKTFDIYYFRSSGYHLWFSEPQKENQYCVTVRDTGSMEVDTLKFKYVWDIGSRSPIPGKTLSHCFPGPGKYRINHDLIDRRTGRLFFRKLTYDIEIFEIEQPFIGSPDVVMAGETVELDALKSFLPGCEITGYFWDFGDGTKSTGERITHSFKSNGMYNVKLGVVLKSGSDGIIQKKVVAKNITVLQSGQDRGAVRTGSPSGNQDFRDIRQSSNIKINKFYSAEEDLKKEAVFQVVIRSSDTRTDLRNAFFRKVPATYRIKELFDPEAGNYSYIVDQQMNLMEVYPAFSEMISSGYPDAFVRIYVLTDPAEKELNVIRKQYGVLTDIFFDSNNRLNTSAYLMLDQVTGIMTRYPGIKLEIGLHTDNQGSLSNNLSVSQFRAQLIVNYLISRGIGTGRLIARGYGGARPVASNTNPAERRLNRRIEFTLVRE